MVHPLGILLLLTFLLSGCVSSARDTFVSSPAVTSKQQSSIDTETGNLPTTIAVLPFTNHTGNKFAYEVVRRTMYNHFSSKNYRMLHWKDVDSRLALAGIQGPEQIQLSDSARLMTLLGVDGLLYGDISHYNKVYAGLYAQISVGVSLTFINQTGAIIWQSEEVKRSHAGGVSMSPVGLIMNALVAAKHLRGDINLYRTADELGRDLAKLMPEPAALTKTEKPRIMDVVHSGVSQILNYGDTLSIGIEGDPGLKAAARIEGLGLVDLREESPGQYIGELSISKALNLSQVSVTGVLQDANDGSSAWVSPYGLLNVDNIPPGRVGDLQAVSRDRQIRLSWRGPQDMDVSRYRVGLSTSELGAVDASYESEDPEYTVTERPNFKAVYLKVRAIDRAGNIGDATVIKGMASPDPRFSEAADLPSVLPESLSGVNRFTVSGSPYYLNSPLTIPADATLLVAPGVEIKVRPSGKLSVYGELLVYGEKNRMVRVHGAGDDGFGNFLTLLSIKSVQINGLEITGGGIPVDIRAGEPQLTDCSILNSRFSAISISGTAKPLVSGCLISGSKTSGVVVDGQSQPRFMNNRFLNNEPFHMQNGSTFSVDARNNKWQPAASTATILGQVRY